MKTKRLVPAVGVTALTLGLITLGLITTTATTATASGTQQTAACELGLGAIDENGALQRQGVTASRPPSVRPKDEFVAKAFPGLEVRLSSSWVHEPNVAGFDYYGKVILGSSMYSAIYRSGDADATVKLTRVGGGWDTFTFFEESRYDEAAGPGSQYHTLEYGLRKDGVLFRWRESGGKWTAAGSYPGFASVKTMALISQTRTYDTFLANTRGGALYTIRIPISNPLKPIVKKVRSSTWQGFETLIAERCGQHGTLLLGIDKETNSGYLYAVGRANGPATVINGLGKLPGTIGDPVNFRWTGVAFANPPLNGD